MWSTRLLECHSDVRHTTDVNFWSAALEMSTILSVPSLEMNAAMEMLVTLLCRCRVSTIGVQLEMFVTNADVDLWSTALEMCHFADDVLWSAALEKFVTI